MNAKESLARLVAFHSWLLVDGEIAESGYAECYDTTYVVP
jgi:hypothetical protein